MKTPLRFVGLFAAAGFVSGPSLTVHAQVGGTGWTATALPPSVPEVSPGCSINGTTFRIISGTGHAGLRYAGFSVGERQFQGSVRVNTLGGDLVSLKLTGSTIPQSRNKIAVKKPAALVEATTGAPLASYSIGSSARINTIASAGTGIVSVYVNGSLRGRVSGLTVPIHDRIGAYPAPGGRGPASVTWSNILFWKR